MRLWIKATLLSFSFNNTPKILFGPLWFNVCQSARHSTPQILQPKPLKACSRACYIFMSATKDKGSDVTSSSETSNGNLFKTYTSSASSLMALQLISRLFTFVLNQAMFRLASPRTFGTAAIQFELMLSTILFLSREGVRNALLRATRNSTATANLSFLPVFIGFPLALVTSYLFGRFAGTETRMQPHFELAIWVYALAALTELLSEPMHNL
jgi:Rft protein